MSKPPTLQLAMDAPVCQPSSVVYTVCQRTKDKQRELKGRVGRLLIYRKGNPRRLSSAICVIENGVELSAQTRTPSIHVEWHSVVGAQNAKTAACSCTCQTQHAAPPSSQSRQGLKDTQRTCRLRLLLTRGRDERRTQHRPHLRAVTGWRTRQRHTQHTAVVHNTTRAQARRRCHPVSLRRRRVALVVESRAPPPTYRIHLRAAVHTYHSFMPRNVGTAPNKQWQRGQRGGGRERVSMGPPLMPLIPPT